MNRCTDCNRQMPSRKAWDALTPEQRAEWRAQGMARMGGRGLCSACRGRRMRDGSLIDVERRNWRSDDLWEEWCHMADPHAHVTAEAQRLAPVFGVSPKRLTGLARQRGWKSRFLGGWGERPNPEWSIA